MKIIVNISRVLVGGLFIFSGLVKAIDPLGLAYKMQEFFEVWARDGYMPGLMNTFNENALMFSIIMIALEVVLGIALLVGWRKHITTWLLLLLIVFFTFLTGFVLFSGKIAACGCFGDCIPLTPVQTFTKDLILLVLIVIILFGKKYIEPFFKSGMVNAMIVLVSLFGVTFLQFYVLKHLPLKDCLPYKPGNNILELRKMPKGAIPDKIEMIFIYEKNGVRKEFTINDLPDSTWTNVDRIDRVIKGENNIPLINDFSMKMSSELFVYEKDGMTAEFEKGSSPDTSWTLIEKKTVLGDSTEAILSQPGEYYLFFIKEMQGEERWSEQFVSLWEYAKQKNRKVYIVTADTKNAEEFFNVDNKYNIPVLTTDVVAIKTAARANPTLFFMKGPVIQGKWSWADMTQGIKN